VGALAILLHFMFDQEGLLDRLPEWNWENSASWRQVCWLCNISWHGGCLCLNLGSCSIWEECCSCDHWRCNRENVHHILRAYFNHFQEKDTSCSPHFSINSQGNGVNKINDLFVTRGGN